MNNEITDDPSLEELASRINSPAEEVQEAPAPEKEQQEASASENNDLPEKFKGKSAAEIYQSYAELEKQLGKISSQRSHAEQEAESVKQRLAEIEARLQAPAQQAQATDPLESLDEELAIEPAKALRRVVDTVDQKVSSAIGRISAESQARETAAYVQRRAQENPDFAELLPEMQSIAKELIPKMGDRFTNTPETVDYLYTLARGKNVDRYVKAATEKAMKSGEGIKEEKRRAFSESGSTGASQDGNVSFEDLSLDQMAAKLPRHNER